MPGDLGRSSRAIVGAAEQMIFPPIKLILGLALPAFFPLTISSASGTICPQSERAPLHRSPTVTVLT